MTPRLALRERARETILAGDLPDRAPERVWGGRGCGVACAVCGERLTPRDAELELEFAPFGQRHPQDGYHLHPRCFSAWDSVRQELESERRAPTATALPAVAAEFTISADEHEAARQRGSP